MDRRQFLKAAIAAPIIVAIPWYRERPTEVRSHMVWMSNPPGDSYFYRQYMAYFDTVEQTVKWSGISDADFWALPTGDQE